MYILTMVDWDSPVFTASFGRELLLLYLHLPQLQRTASAYMPLVSLRQMAQTTVGMVSPLRCLEKVRGANGCKLLYMGYGFGAFNVKWGASCKIENEKS